MGRIILIAGPPGAGKTTVSRQIRLRLPSAVRIEGDQFWAFYHPTDNQVKKPFRMLMRSMLAAALPFAKEGYDVFIDFVFPPWFIDTAKKVIAGRDTIELHYFIIQPSEALCSERAGQREEGRIDNYEEYAKLYQSFCEMPEHHIGHDASSVEELVAYILEEIPTQKYLVC